MRRGTARNATISVTKCYTYMMKNATMRSWICSIGCRYLHWSTVSISLFTLAYQDVFRLLPTLRQSREIRNRRTTAWWMIWFGLIRLGAKKRPSQQSKNSITQGKPLWSSAGLASRHCSRMRTWNVWSALMKRKAMDSSFICGMVPTRTHHVWQYSLHLTIANTRMMLRYSLQIQVNSQSCQLIMRQITPCTLSAAIVIETTVL